MKTAVPTQQRHPVFLMKLALVFFSFLAQVTDSDRYRSSVCIVVLCYDFWCQQIFAV